MREWLIRLLRLIEPEDKLVHVVSWWPLWDGHELLWPYIRIDRRGYSRLTCWPVWDWVRLRDVLRIPPPQYPPSNNGTM